MQTTIAVINGKCYVLGTELITLLVISFNSQSYTIVPISHMVRLRFREVKYVNSHGQ